MIYPSEYTNPLDDPNYGIKSREDEFFYRFKNEIPEPSVVFYNVILKLAGVGLREIDFLLVSLFGIFIIELKNVKYKYENNKWQFYKAWNKEWKDYEEKANYRNPIEQIQTASRELLEFIKINNKGSSPVSLDYIYPVLILLKNEKGTLEFNTKGVNILYQDEYNVNFNRIFRATSEHITEKKINKVADIILNNTNYLQTFERRMEKHNKKIIALTKEQYGILNDLEKPNILLTGVAGSGKTLIALEAARIAKKKVWKTLFICRSSNLNKYLNAICTQDNLTDISIMTMTSFCNQIIKTLENQGLEIEKIDYSKGEDYVRVLLPKFVNGYLNQLEKIEPVDFLIVDEAQDIMSFEELSLLENFLKGGYDNGKWLVCYDEEQALFGEIKEGLEYLETFSPKNHKLSVNKRTPKSIYELACLVSKKKKGEAELEDYTTIQFQKYSSVEEGKDLLFQLVDNAVKVRKFAIEDIIILSPHPKAKTEILGSQINLKSSKSKEHYKIKKVEEGEFSPNCVGFSEIARFKGMERKFIILTGIENFEDMKLRNTIYVGLTRSTHMCAIVYNKNSTNSLKKAMGKIDINKFKSQ